MGPDGWAYLVAWAIEEGVVERVDGPKLLQEGEKEPEKALLTIGRAVTLGRALGCLIRNIAGGGDPEPSDLAVLNVELTSQLGTVPLEPGRTGYRWAWEQVPGLERILYPVVRSAANLLISNDLQRVKACQGPSCDWVFLDATKNRSRRWCDMRSCGNREKMRRYRKRRKAESSPNPEIAPQAP